MQIKNKPIYIAAGNFSVELHVSFLPSGTRSKYCEVPFLLDMVIGIFISKSQVIDIHLFQTYLLQIQNVTVKFKTAWETSSLFFTEVL